jgi:hypothetical protein
VSDGLNEHQLCGIRRVCLVVASLYNFGIELDAVLLESRNFGPASAVRLHAARRTAGYDLQLEKGQIGHQVVCVILHLLAEVFLENVGVLGVVSSDAADQLVTEE